MKDNLYRSEANKVLGGVCGGLGEYFDIDPVIFRIAMVILVLSTGVALIGYIVAWIIIPRREPGSVQPDTQEMESTPKEFDKTWRKYLPGLVLIGIGTILLIHQHWYWLGWEELLPVALIIVGLALIFGKGRRRNQTESSESAKSSNPGLENGGGTQ